VMRTAASRLLLIVVLSNGMSTTGRATILLFDQIRVGGTIVPTISGNSVPQDYGDHATGPSVSAPGGSFTYGEAGEGFTPNVMADYFTTANSPGSSLWEVGFGDLTNVLFGNQNSLSMNVLLTADAGFDVLLYGFDLGGWPNADYVINAVSVFDGLTPLFSQGNVLVEGDAVGPGRTSFAFGSALVGNSLLIEIDYSNLLGGQQDNIGIDNIRFGQDPLPQAAVPEPSTLWLLLSALFAAKAVFRRPTSA